MDYLLVSALLVVVFALVGLLFLRERQHSEEMRVVVGQMVQIATRPPYVVNRSDGTNVPQIVDSIGSAMSKVAFGDPRPAEAVNLVEGLDETAGVKPGMWYPDVELDEWLTRNGEFPTRAGWLPPPTTRTEYVPATPDQSTEAQGGLTSVPRHQMDTRMFQAGDSGPLPTNNTE